MVVNQPTLCLVPQTEWAQAKFNSIIRHHIILEGVTNFRKLVIWVLGSSCDKPLNWTEFDHLNNGQLNF